MATDRAYRKQQEAGALSSAISGGGAQLGGSLSVIDPINTISAVHSDLFPIYKAAADGAAATTTAETFSGIFLPQLQGTSPLAGTRAYKVNGIYFNSVSGPYVADPVNNAAIIVTARDANGNNPVVIGTLTTNLASGNANQGGTKAFTLAATNPAPLAFGATFTYTINKGGTGVVVPAGVITIDVEAV